MKEYLKLFLITIINYFLISVALWFLFATFYTMAQGMGDFLNLMNNFSMYEFENYLKYKAHIQEQINVYFVIFLISFVLVVITHILMLKKKGLTYIQYLKIKLLPYFFGFYNNIEKDTKKKNKKKKYQFDEVFRIKKGAVIYRNVTGIDYEKYNKAKESIEHFLNLEIFKIDKMYPSRVILRFKDPLNQFEFDKSYFRDSEVYFGKGVKSGDIYIPLKDLTHYLIVGQSGSGKSVFQNLLINNILYNLDKVEKLYLVDLKAGVEFTQYKKVNLDKIEVISDISELLPLTQKLIEIMENRYKEMIERDIKNWDKEPIIIFIDEYASIKDQGQNLEKNDFKELNNNIRTLLAKARASGIKFFIATQKATSDSIDTTVRENLQTKILLRTVSKDAQRAVLGGNEILEELGVNPARFGKGRYIFYGELIQDLVQAPYIPDTFYKNFIND
jgi:hypothetical protein